MPMRGFYFVLALDFFCLGFLELLLSGFAFWLGFHFVICISTGNLRFGEGRVNLLILGNLFNFSRCRLRFGLLTVCGGFTSCISKQLIKSIHYFRRNSNHSGEDGIGVT